MKIAVWIIVFLFARKTSACECEEITQLKLNPLKAKYLFKIIGQNDKDKSTFQFRGSWFNLSNQQQESTRFPQNIPFKFICKSTDATYFDKKVYLVATNEENFNKLSDCNSALIDLTSRDESEKLIYALSKVKFQPPVWNPSWQHCYENSDCIASTVKCQTVYALNNYTHKNNKEDVRMCVNYMEKRATGKVHECELRNELKAKTECNLITRECILKGVASE